MTCMHLVSLPLRPMDSIAFEGDEYSSATAKTIDETSKLVEAGFDYVWKSAEHNYSEKGNRLFEKHT